MKWFLQDNQCLGEIFPIILQNILDSWRGTRELTPRKECQEKWFDDGKLTKKLDDWKSKESIPFYVSKANFFGLLNTGDMKKTIW